MFCCVCVVLGRLAPAHRVLRAVRCVASAVSSVTWLLCTDVLDRCVVLLLGVRGGAAGRTLVHRDGFF